MRLRRIVFFLGILMFALGFYLFKTYDKPLVILPDEPVQPLHRQPVEQTITTSKKIYTPPQPVPPKPALQPGKTPPAAPSFTKITPQPQLDIDVNRPPQPPKDQAPPEPQPPKDDIP